MVRGKREEKRGKELPGALGLNHSPQRVHLSHPVLITSVIPSINDCEAMVTPSVCMFVLFSVDINYRVSCILKLNAAFVWVTHPDMYFIPIL